MEPLPRVVNTIEEKAKGDRVREGPIEGGETIKDMDTDRSDDGMSDVINDLQVDHRSASVLPVICTI